MLDKISWAALYKISTYGGFVENLPRWVWFGCHLNSCMSGPRARALSVHRPGNMCDPSFKKEAANEQEERDIENGGIKEIGMRKHV